MIFAIIMWILIFMNVILWGGIAVGALLRTSKELS